MKVIILSSQAAKQLDALPLKPRQNIENALNIYAQTGQGDVLKLSGRNGYRMRVGEYRVIFDEDQNTILAIYIGQRATTTYRKF